MRCARAALAVALLTAAAGAAGAAEPPPPPSITVAGAGIVSVRPDVAEVFAGVLTQAATPGQALAENTARVNKVLATIAGLGIPDRDVQTTSITVSPQRAQPRAGSQQPAAIVGYDVLNQVRVKVRDFAALGRLLDAVVAQGANTMGGVAFYVADPAPLLQQARTQAIADAERKARTYAAAAGVKLGRVLQIRDEATGWPRPVHLTGMAAQVPVAPGEQEIGATVTVTYAIE